MTATLECMEDAAADRLGTREDDTRLAGLVARGEAGALGELYDRYGAACFRLALRITANRSIAEEVVQESFLALWRADSYAEQAGSLRSWLFALVHHKAVDAVRRESSMARRQNVYASREQTVADPGSDPEQSTLGAIRDEEVRAALSDLSPEQREALVLAYFGGHTQREIAELTGIPLGTVKTRMFSGMRRLQGSLRGIVEIPREGPQ